LLQRHYIPPDVFPRWVFAYLLLGQNEDISIGCCY
jgi:hypothetical protein